MQVSVRLYSRPPKNATAVLLPSFKGDAGPSTSAARTHRLRYPARPTVLEADPVQHPVTHEPVVVAPVLHGPRVGPDAEVDAVQLEGDLSDNWQVLGIDLVVDRSEVPHEIRVGHQPPL